MHFDLGMLFVTALWSAPVQHRLCGLCGLLWLHELCNFQPCVYVAIATAVLAGLGCASGGAYGCNNVVSSHGRPRPHAITMRAASLVLELIPDMDWTCHDRDAGGSCPYWPLCACCLAPLARLYL
jgi:hypothetical protein